MRRDRHCAGLPRIEYARLSREAYVRAVKYRRFRVRVLCCVLAWMAARKAAGR